MNASLGGARLKGFNLVSIHTLTETLSPLPCKPLPTHPPSADCRTRLLVRIQQTRAALTTLLTGQQQLLKTLKQLQHAPEAQWPKKLPTYRQAYQAFQTQMREHPFLLSAVQRENHALNRDTTQADLSSIEGIRTQLATALQYFEAVGPVLRDHIEPAFVMAEAAIATKIHRLANETPTVPCP
jgi:hypothetical protein